MSTEKPRSHKFHYPNARYPLQDPEFIATLEPRTDPYWMMLANGRALGLQRWKGSYWHARLKLKDGRYKRTSLGAADDKGRIGNRRLMSFDEAREAAESWFAELQNEAVTPLTFAEREIELPTPRPGRTYTVGHALRDHLLWLQGCGKDIEGVARVARSVLMPEFGGIPVSHLSAEQIREWMDRAASRIDHALLADVPLGARQALHRELTRRRRRTVNHDLCILRKALDHAFINRKTGSDAEWRRVRGFPHVHAPKPCDLDDQTLCRFLEAAPPDLALLCKAALLTGARLSELMPLQCEDFIQATGKLFFAHTKSGPPRAHILSEEARAVFLEAAAGRGPEETLLVRRDGRPWTTLGAKYEVRRACQAAAVLGVNFRAFRHTYGTRLAEAGLPLRVIAHQMGHKFVQTTEHYYAHLSADQLDEAIRRLVPKMLPT